MTQVSSTQSSYRFIVVSTCPEAWGGSEELWWGASSLLAEQGHSVAVLKTEVDETHPRIQRLKSLGCPVWDLEKVWKRAASLSRLLPQRFQLTPLRTQRLFLKKQLKSKRPHLVIISQGDNLDGLAFAHLCRTMKQPYVLIAQKASDSQWPSDRARKGVRENYQGAHRCFFVSRHNQQLTEDQIGLSLPQAQVVRNPFLVSAMAPLAWPTKTGNEEAFHLACVGRLYIPDKGQDILLRVLAQNKWRSRNLHVSFFGKGIHREGLIALAARLGVEKVSFLAHTSDVPSIWKKHHALILASRAEGLPLVLVEAMMCGRPAIVTSVGGNTEILEDDSTGFVAAGAHEAALDEALERAWSKRAHWHEMGELAAHRVRELVPPDPAREFASHLLDVVTEQKTN